MTFSCGRNGNSIKKNYLSHMSDKTECYLLLTSVSLVKDCDPYPKEPYLLTRVGISGFVNCLQGHKLPTG